jgi:peptidoglycan/LPS O-acetylase OafA/YrhL
MVPEPNYSGAYHKAPDRFASESKCLGECQRSDTLEVDSRPPKVDMLLIPENLDRNRSNNFNALRLFFALAVVWSHSFALFQGSEATEPTSELLNGIYNAGTVSVFAFFTISGFLISQSWSRSSTWHSYLRKRVARIYPGYLVAVTLCSLLVVPLFSTLSFADYTRADWLGMASNVLLRNFIVGSNAFNGVNVNGSLWSIPYEFWCYIGILGLGLTGLFAKRTVILVIAILVMVIRAWLDLTGRKHWGGGWLEVIFGYQYRWFGVLPSFLLGAAAYQYRSTIRRSGWILIAMVAALVIACHLPVAAIQQDVMARLIFPPTLAYLVFYVAFANFGLPDAGRFGDFSYGTYLYAFPIQQMLASVWKDQLPFPLLILVSLLLALIAGVFSWFAVERWFMLSKSKRLN